jgi:progesterone-induced-blocking factor 1
LIFEFRSL